ncbi:hypothetical protein EJB05_28183 [Eragrostis curvula]|uniref:Uncharacterized protein n=1 Tax=Eragrostis curvula TaxID=38414 RepID=A0A5J9UQQ1_9POAL|nr:hypothetical protein EJB05_28183 [Eragrostis curvula]
MSISTAHLGGHLIVEVLADLITKIWPSESTSCPRDFRLKFQSTPARTSGLAFLSRLARSSGAFSIVTAPNAPFRRLPPFISGGAEDGAGVAIRHRSRPAARSLPAGADEAEAEAWRRRGSRPRRWRGAGTRAVDRGCGCERGGNGAVETPAWQWEEAAAREAVDAMRNVRGGVGVLRSRFAGRPRG